MGNDNIDAGDDGDGGVGGGQSFASLFQATSGGVCQ